MKIVFLILTLFFYSQIFSQNKENRIFLLEFESCDLLLSIKYQGKKQFEKSSCYVGKMDYYIFPHFMATSSAKIADLDFRSGNTLLKGLYFNRESKNKKLKDVSWEVFSKTDRKKIADSDSKRFYCYKSTMNPYNFGKDFDKIYVKEIKYSFYIYNTFMVYNFIVDNENNIFVHLAKNGGFEIYTLTEFNKLYKSGDLVLTDGLFTDNR